VRLIYLAYFGAVAHVHLQSRVVVLVMIYSFSECWIIIFVNDQLDAQFFFRICLLQISTCFEYSCAHHQEN
jgi:hypothetical protein